jgi:MFS family permease
MSVAGAAAFLAGARLLPPDPPAARPGLALDVAGIVVLALSLGAYALAATLASSGGATQAVLAIAAIAGAAGFVAVEARAASPLVDLRLLRDGALGAGLAALALVSAIMMTTLVVGPFYLSGALGLDAVRTGLAMSVGPGVAALAGVPAGRLVDRLGAPAMTVAGLAAVAAGALLMTALPALFGVAGYVGSLALVTAGYALFQAANTTALTARAPAARRGVTSALIGLARNLGLVTGASAMGALFAFGARGQPLLGLPPGGETGLRLAFAVAAAAAVLALGLAGWGVPSRRLFGGEGRSGGL